MVTSKANPYDIFSPQAQRDHILHEQMRCEDPVHAVTHPQTGQIVWFLTRYDDCLNFLRDKRFGKDYRRLPTHLSEQRMTPDAVDVVNQHMLNLDDPAHARLKSLVHGAFTPLRINSLRKRLESIADQLLDTILLETEGGDEFDLTERYIRKFPLIALVELLGFPMTDYPVLFGWTQTMLLSDQTVVHAAIAEFSRYLQVQIDLRQANADAYDDLLSGLVFSEDAGDRLNRQELLAMVYLLITAGYETMVNFIGNAILTLFENPEQLSVLQANLDDPVIVRSAVEEMLRYAGPSHMTLASWAFVDVDIGGKVIHQGDIVHAVLHAANRDPLVFEDPHTFDILRHPNKHIAFSYGIHHCLGAALARLEGDIAIVTLLRRMPNM